jgi:predicted nucleic acid-binding protein
LSGDALVVAVMRENGLAHLASHDADFDGVPGLTRYSPA